MPWPVSTFSPQSKTFAVLVAQYQILRGLAVDGMLGPATFAVMQKGTPKEASEPMTQSARYSAENAAKANLTLDILGIASWEPGDIGPVQEKVGAKADGWFGPKSIEKWKKWKRTNNPEPVDNPANYQAGGKLDAGHAIIQSIAHPVPAGLKYVNHLEPGGIPAQMNDTSERKHTVTQLVLHRGWSGSYKPGRNFAAKTEETLDARGLSGSHSMDIDGTIYQHFDPAIRRGRHASHHNVQSDSLDIGGPFGLKATPAPGQVKLTLKMAIGRSNDGKPPMNRAYGTVKCWSMPQAQIEALALFLPWWCKLRGIPLTACSDWRCFRVGDLGRQDPVTDVKGILAHTQISGPGARVDGILPLHHMLEAGVDLGWRGGDAFFS